MPSHMLTTTDNPFDPFTQFDEWNSYDSVVLGYNTLSFLARVVNYSDDMSEADVDFAIEQGIEEIVRENVLGIYMKAIEPSDSAVSDKTG